MIRTLRRWWWAVAVLVVAGLPVAWYLASPLFIDRIVAEQFTASGGELARGMFTDADGFHKGSGTARAVSLPEGAELRFEAFQVTNGPDLYVYLAAHPQPRSRAQVDEGFVNLGRLKGNVGPQAYAIPPGTDLRQYRSVVIYCRAFHVVFSTATLKLP
jgi:hypothetical protein